MAYICCLASSGHWRVFGGYQGILICCDFGLFEQETANNVRKIHSGAALEEIGDAPELTGMEEVTAGSAVDDTSAIEARYQEELRKELKAVDSVDTEDKGNSEVEAGGKRKPASEVWRV